MAAKKTTTKKAAAKKSTAVRKTAGKTAAKKAGARKRAVVEEEYPDEPAGTTSLVIVESPAKAKTIGKYLGRGYRVKATVGHIMDLPRRSSVSMSRMVSSPISFQFLERKRRSPTSRRPPRCRAKCSSPPILIVRERRLPRTLRRRSNQ